MYMACFLLADDFRVCGGLDDTTDFIIEGPWAALLSVRINDFPKGRVRVRDTSVDGF